MKCNNSSSVRDMVFDLAKAPKNFDETEANEPSLSKSSQPSELVPTFSCHGKQKNQGNLWILI